jgi:hypothetical protein
MKLKSFLFICIFSLITLCTSYAQEKGQAELKNGNLASSKELWTEAFIWFEKAASKGNAEAMYHLAYMWENGQGRDQDYAKAMQWYKKAIENNYHDALIALGIIYQNNDLFSEAENCYKLAATKGINSGLELLGFLNLHQQKYHEALDWFQKAAHKKEKEAMYQIGLMYMDGLGVKASEIEAKKWFKKAADDGHKEAKEKL